MTRLRPHLITIAALFVCALSLHPDFAFQQFYSDDFLFLKDSRDWSLGQYLGSLFSSPANSEWTYWRPGLRLSLAAMYSLFGLNDVAYMVVGFALHCFAAALVYSLVAYATKSWLFGLLAGLWLVSSPAAVESYTWVVCSFGVLPASILVFASGWCFVGSLESERRGFFSVSIFLAGVSLAFREPAYQMPFVVVGLSWIHDRRIGAAALRSMPFVAMAAFHFLVLNEVSTEGAGVVDLIATSLQNEAKLIRAVFGLGGPDALVLILSFTCAAVAMWFGDRRGRSMVWWSLFACLPYIAKATSTRHAYLLQLCFAVASCLVLAHVFRSRSRGRLLAFAVMGALILVNLVRLPGVQRSQRAMGEQSAQILEWSRGQDLGRFDLLMPDFVPLAIENGWSAMLSLHLGLDVEVYPNNSLPRPPFQILFQDVFVGDAKVAYLHFDQATGGYSMVPKSAMFGDRIVVPLLSVVDGYQVATPADALARVVRGDVDVSKKVLVDRAPSLPFEPTGGSRVIESGGWPHVEIEVDAKGPCYLVICLPVRLRDAAKIVTVDGEVVEPVCANGVFDAVWLDTGRHEVVIH